MIKDMKLTAINFKVKNDIFSKNDCNNCNGCWYCDKHIEFLYSDVKYLFVSTKNTSKLENLLLIGYSPIRVAMPYELLTLGLNAIVLIIALLMISFIRNYYMGVIGLLFPQIDEGNILPSVILGFILFTFVSIMNFIAIYRKVIRIWWRKDS